MRSLLFALAFPLLAQQQSVVYTRDLNGDRVLDSVQTSARSGNAVTRTELTQSVNGRFVPLESVEERVLRDDTGGRIVERLIRRYDQNGNPGPPEKQRVEERKNPDGSTNSSTTTYRGDLNGRFELAERVVVDSSKSGAAINSNVTVERPTLNGTLEIVEKQARVVTDEPNGSRADTTTYRKNPSNEFTQAVRTVAETTTRGNETTEKVAQYEPGLRGQMQLSQQTVTQLQKNSDGTVSRVVDWFRNVPGRSDNPPGTLLLTERQIIDQKRVDGKLVETTVAQRPSINDPNRLSAPQKLSERVCVGANCK